MDDHELFERLRISAHVFPKWTCKSATIKKSRRFIARIQVESKKQLGGGGDLPQPFTARGPGLEVVISSIEARVESRASSSSSLLWSEFDFTVAVKTEMADTSFSRSASSSSSSASRRRSLSAWSTSSCNPGEGVIVFTIWCGGRQDCCGSQLQDKYLTHKTHADLVLRQPLLERNGWNVEIR